MPLKRLLGIVVSCFAVAGAALALGAKLGYTASVSEKLVDRLAERYGAGARARLVEWKVFAQARKAEVVPDGALLGPVNGFFNRLPFVSDLANWGVQDYWATPAEALASNGADCEDYSVAKYFMLKELGVPISKLRLFYVRTTRFNGGHMVLVYYPVPGGDPLILDNLEESVLPAAQRPDLVPVYSFNDDEVRLADSLRMVEGRRRDFSIEIRQWRELLIKLEREAAL